jgi:hypothetical protein
VDAYLPDYAFNGIGDLFVGQGYQVYNGTSDTLTLAYPVE